MWQSTSSLCLGGWPNNIRSQCHMPGQRRVLEGLQGPHVWRCRECSPHLAPLLAPGMPPSLGRGLFPASESAFASLSVHELFCPRHIRVCGPAQFLSVIQWFELQWLNHRDCKYSVLKSPGPWGRTSATLAFSGYLPTRLLRRLVLTLRGHSSLPYIAPLKSPKLSFCYWFQWESWRPS